MVDGRQNEQNGFIACTTDDGFRNLLFGNQNTPAERKRFKDYFQQYNITFDTDDQLEAVLDQIAVIQWNQLKTLEDRLYGHDLDILTG